MSFPNYPDKHKIEPLFKAEDLVAYRERLGRMPKIKPAGVLFCLERGLPHRMRWRIPVERAGSMNADVYAVKKTKGKVGVLTSFGGGSPMVVELAEELAVMGAKRMILMTWGGILRAELKPGDIVVCDEAIRDDGASHHYLPHEKSIRADTALVNELVDAIHARGAQCTVGTTWTTDAPYRETRAEVMQITDIFRAKIVDVQPKSLTIEITGNESKVEKFLDLMKTFGTVGLTRTGKVALPRK